MLDELMRDHTPVGALETDLVRQMAEHLWLKERAARFQAAYFLVLGQTPEQKPTIGWKWVSPPTSNASCIFKTTLTDSSTVP